MQARTINKSDWSMSDFLLTTGNRPISVRTVTLASVSSATWLSWHQMPLVGVPSVWSCISSPLTMQLAIMGFMLLQNCSGTSLARSPTAVRAVRWCSWSRFKHLWRLWREERDELEWNPNNQIICCKDVIFTTRTERYMWRHVFLILFLPPFPNHDNILVQYKNKIVQDDVSRPGVFKD